MTDQRHTPVFTELGGTFAAQVDGVRLGGPIDDTIAGDRPVGPSRPLA